MSAEGSHPGGWNAEVDPGGSESPGSSPSPDKLISSFGPKFQSESFAPKRSRPHFPDQTLGALLRPYVDVFAVGAYEYVNIYRDRPFTCISRMKH